MRSFVHLHCHTQYSLLDGAAHINPLIRKAKSLGMPALAITDHGNMFGVGHFVEQAKRQGIKPIIGCEFYLALDMTNHKEKTRYHQLLLAKNEIGYQNLIKLSSLSYTKGYYYKPRIDKVHIKKYANGLIATTSCLSGEIPRTYFAKGAKAAEEVFLSWLEIFGDDYYIELQRHGIQEQDDYNLILCKWAMKYGVKMVATNDVHYIEQTDSFAQDILLCLQTGADYNDPKRMRFQGDQFFLKSPQQMAELFQDIPEAIDNTVSLAEKVSSFDLEKELQLPKFNIPSNFPNEEAYLTHLTLKGAKQLYGNISADLQQRIDKELTTITAMRYEGYFLIVRDLIQTARAQQIMVGIGRGSVAGSVVAYALGITKVDPIPHQLIFERFLNEERFSPADIDIDIEDKKRNEFISGPLVNKYGYNQVAQVITFGTMGAKSVIRDVARMLSLPLARADYLAKLVPDKLGTTLKQAFAEVPELDQLQKKEGTLEAQVLRQAVLVEGSIRHTGIHAAAIIIGPDDLTNYLPVKTEKKTGLLVTQYDGRTTEQVGMLKMDLLGLKTLSIIKDSIAFIKENCGKELDPDTLTLDDAKTFNLFQQGNTVGVFQFESEGMRKWLRKLRPTHLDDLIAMNALYRPGPMQFIPNFIARKQKQEKVVYPHPLLEDLLRGTYGIMVYQEQIMQTAQLIAGYTLAQADLLRRAMGKKKPEEMARNRSIFLEGAKKKHQITKEKAEEIFSMMEKFAEYGFPKAHSTAYALTAYQTAYLKANYPTEFMAAVLMNSEQDITKIATFLKECRYLGVEVQGPDINESANHFRPIGGKIRFGLAGVKSVGQGAAETLVTIREEKGPYENIHDFFSRLVGTKINKKVLESLAKIGTFDNLDNYHRKQYLFKQEDEENFIERYLKQAQNLHRNQNTNEQWLFPTEEINHVQQLSPPTCSPYTRAEILSIEREALGFYISGHPLANFSYEVEKLCNATTQYITQCRGKKVCLAGVVTNCTKHQTRTGSYYIHLTIEDYVGSLQLKIFTKNIEQYLYLFQEDQVVYVRGTVQTYYEDKHEVDVETIIPLQEIREKHTTKMQLILPTQYLNEESVTAITKAIEAHPGRCSLQILFIEEDKETKVPTLSTNYKINPVVPFFELLDGLPGITYRLAYRQI